ncbi:hypothetical protein ACHAQH_006369 [Verticillium albo-atrum]
MPDNLKHILDTTKGHPADANTQFDLARPGGWCPVSHGSEIPCPRAASPDLHSTLALHGVPNIPTYLDTEVFIMKRILTNIAKVSIPNVRRDMICKFATSDMSACGVFRELQSLLILAAAYPDSTGPDARGIPRTARLLGIIRSSDHGGVVGMVEAFIPHMHPVPPSEARKEDRHLQLTLGDMILTEVDASRRTRWGDEIEKTIRAAHQAGITWSDVKPDNVLIHSATDEAWVIDFGGGCTDGWADPYTAGTVDEDLAMVRRIQEYLDLGKVYHSWRTLKYSGRVIE